jgi:hypothetical protein
MKEEIFQIVGEIKKVESMASGSIRLRIESQENLTPAQKGRIMSLVNQYGFMCFLPGENKIEAEELVSLDLPKIVTTKPSKSKKMRSALYRLWESRGMPNPNQLEAREASEAFYNARMDSMTSQIIGQIED